MTNQDLGYTKNLEEYRKENGLDIFEIGRVLSEHKERYIIKSDDQEFDSELIGNLRYTAESRSDFPAVGDWVAFSEYDEGKALIHAIFPRHSVIERQAVAKSGQVQIIATNVDAGLIVQAVDRDFNINRIERYLTICNSSNIEPIIILSKIDLLAEQELDNLIEQLELRVKNTVIIKVSSEIENGYQSLNKIIQMTKTYCLLGSSGVGKSTLLNNLSGQQLMQTGHISSSVNKGRHVTSHRELIVLSNGGILIDNPGMREVGIADGAKGLETTFDSILQYAQNCRYKDCTHIHEKGCAILEAIDNGDIDEDAYSNFRKLEREKSHFESDAQEKKKKDKDLGKIIKKFQKQRRQNKY